MHKATTEAPVRLLSLDALRGSVMLALASGGFGLTAAARHFPGNPFWQFLACQCKHAPWIGCSLADLLQPTFLFIVGAALPLAQANRRGQGQSEGRIAWRAVRRAAAFLALGVLFEANQGGGMAISFVNVLAQIGLGYVFVALLARCRFSYKLLSISVILIGTWLAFALYPLPQSSVVSQASGNLSSGRLPGFFAHWNKHDNIAAAFDRRFLNLLPRSKSFVRQVGGYETLNFVPSMATMLLGALAGQLLLSRRTPSRKFALLLAAALLSWQAGLILSWTICPCVKRLWTPSWVLVSGGGAFLALALFYWLIEVRRYRRWCLPLAGIGRTTLLLYAAFGMVQFLKPIVPQAVWHCLDSLPHDIVSIRLVKVYGVPTLALLLVLVLWRMGRRIHLRQQLAKSFLDESPRERLGFSPQEVMSI
jgi:heparan-alpha-glucosaminide N-acetyltransferase